MTLLARRRHYHFDHARHISKYYWLWVLTFACCLGTQQKEILSVSAEQKIEKCVVTTWPGRTVLLCPETTRTTDSQGIRNKNYLLWLDLNQNPMGLEFAALLLHKLCQLKKWIKACLYHSTVDEDRLETLVTTMDHWIEDLLPNERHAMVPPQPQHWFRRATINCRECGSLQLRDVCFHIN